MELKLLVQIPDSPRYRALALTYTGSPGGTQLAEALARAFQLDQASWTLGGLPLPQLRLGQAPLISGAVLDWLPGSQPTGQATAPSTSQDRDQEPAVFTLRALHGPDSFTSFPLSRGRWRLGRNSGDITLADPALKPFEAELEVYHSHLVCTTDQGPHTITLNTPFWLGNTLLVLQDRDQSMGPPKAEEVRPSPEPQEIDVPARRSTLLTAAMMLFPLIIGLTIALFTKMWLILLMALGSSLLMGIHALSSGGESKKARQLISTTAEQELHQLRQGPQLAGHPGHILLGSCRRPAHVQGKNRAIDRLPHLDAVPHYLPLAQLLAEPLNLPLATLRFILAQLPHHYPHLVIHRAPTNSPAYADLTEPLLALPTTSPLDSTQQQPAEALIITETGTPGLPQTEGKILSLTCGRGPASTVFAPNIQLDGISPSTYRALLHSQAQGTTESTRDRALSSPTSRELPAFAPASPASPKDDIPFFLGINPHTGQHLSYGLNRHGPHFLLAGTTGSGKSQLLRSILWSAALATPPERLALILIDFKGGAGLGPLSHLPHCKTLISDLDSSGLTRSLKYLRADLKHREEDFHALGLSSYQDYLAHCAQQGQHPAYPEVLLCIDEFRMLVDDYPDIMTEFMRIATIGRSLGYHLILATQRPQGAISQDIRANIATSICLRVGSTQDSYNVIGAEDAAQIPAGQPGAGYVRDSDHELIPFQAPLINGPYQKQESLSSLRIISTGQHLSLQQDPHQGGFDDRALSAACAQLATRYPATSYTPIRPIPHPSYDARHGQASTSLHLGTLEIPELGSQTPWTWQGSDGPCLLLGSLTDRSATVLALLGQALAVGYQAICISSSEQFAHTIATTYPSANLPCAVYSPKDFDFIRHLLAQLAGGSKTPVFLLLDGLDGFQDTLPRFPDTEAHLQELLMPLGSQATAVLATSASAPRGRLQHAFSHTLLTVSYLEQDPIRSHQKTYNRPPAGAFALEGAVPAALSRGTVGAGILYPVPGPVSFPEGLKVLSPCYRQLPAVYRVDQLLADYDLAGMSRPICGLGRQGPLQLPQLAGGFMAISGPRGSGKTQLLASLARLSPGTPSIRLTAQGSTSTEDIRSLVERAGQGAVRPQLLIDDLQRLSSDAQHLVLQHRSVFERVLVAYSPWPRWSTSPLLSALSGTETGIVLGPQSTADLSFYPGTVLPLDLKTQGHLPPGRGVLIQYGEAIPFQVPLLPPSSPSGPLKSSGAPTQM